jgi:two-component system LytT family sensor kinase
MVEYARMKTNQEKKSFFGCCKESIGTTLIITQVAAVVITIILSVYGQGRLYVILILTFLFSNSIGLSTHMMFATADYFRFVPYSEEKKRFKLSSVLLTLAGMLIGSEMTMLIDNIFLGYMNIPFWSSTHLKILGVNFFLASLIGLGGHTFVKTRKRLEQKILENQKIKHLRTQAQLLALQSKINPHFLFNTLNTMLSLVYKSPEKVETMILNLSDIYRKVLQLPENELITLKEETDLIREYLEIEKIRMGERLGFNISLEPELETIKIPPLLIEPIVENAVIHGISPRPQGGTVDIEIKRNANKIAIQILDNGTGFETHPSKTGFGLQSIRERLQLIYKDRADFKMNTPSTGGTCVILELPYEQ